MLMVGSFFSGIGGIELGLTRTGGFTVVYHVEKEPYCQSVLRRHFPDIPIYDDIIECYGAGAHSPRRWLLPYTDVLVGGFPCQNISMAGDKAGIDRGEKSGLWREFARLIGEIRPRYVLVENVAALRYARKKAQEAAGLARVLGDLSEIGYDAEWQCLRAADVGAPHTRDRLFLVAYPSEQHQQRNRGTVLCQQPWGTATARRETLRQQNGQTSTDSTGSVDKSLGHAASEGLSQWGYRGDKTDSPQTPAGMVSQFERSGVVANSNRPRREEYDPSSRSDEVGYDSCAVVTPGYERDALCGVGRVFDGTTDWLDFVRENYRWPARPGEQQYDWEPPRVLPKGTGRNRTSRIKALGNAVVPACAEVVGYCLLDYERRRMCCHE